MAKTEAERKESARQASLRYYQRNRGKQQAAHRSWYAKNAEQERKRTRKFYEANKTKEQARTRAKNREKLPPPTRPEPEWCECCGRFLERTPHLDHDHKTNVFRGWLCNPCNRGLGFFGDNVEGVEKALAYLKRAA